MQDSKLIELIKTFGPKEHKQLQKFVEFKNTGDGKIAILIDYLLKFAPDFKMGQVNNESLFKLLYPERDTFKDVLVRRCVSRSLHLIEEFIVYLKGQENERLKQLTLIDYYNEHKLERHFEAVWRKWNKMKEQQVINADFFYEEFLVENKVSMRLFRKQDRTVEPNLEQVSHNLDAFYLICKLTVCCTIYNYQVLSVTKYDLYMVEEVISFLEKRWSSFHSLVQAYYFALLTLKEPEIKQHFNHLKKVLSENLSQFDFDQQGNLLSLAQNYCIKQINKGDQSYLTELFELYKIGLELEVLLENGLISPLDYNNIVTLGTRIKSYDWTEQFIEKYNSKLEESFRESAYHYNMARLFFSKKEFSEVIGLLHQVEHRELLVDLSVKVLLLKTYYELEEMEALVSLTESFRMFLSRKKNLGYHKNRYQNFLKFLRHLMRLQVASDSEKEAFKQTVENAKGLIEKDWFLEKIE